MVEWRPQRWYAQHGCQGSQWKERGPRHPKLGSSALLVMPASLGKPTQLSRELWAYMSFIVVREAWRCGGNGWYEYDSMVRQQAASAMELQWSKLVK